MDVNYEYNQPDYSKKWIYINNQKWFFKLQHEDHRDETISLIGSIGVQQPKHTIIVAYTPNTIKGYKNDLRPYRQNNGKQVYLYGIFKDEVILYDYMNNMDVENRCFYEVILGNQQQKPKFDIDIAKGDFTDEEHHKIYMQTLSDVFNGIEEVFDDLDTYYDLNNIMLFTSHNENKKSAHIILDRINVCNNTDAKEFYNKVIKYCPDTYKYIDQAVYGITQQFRLFKSSKMGHNRIKEFIPSFVNKNKLFKYNIDYIKYYEKLPNTTEEEKEFRKRFKGIKILIGSLINYIKYPTLKFEQKEQKEIIRDKIEDDKINDVINIIDTKYKNIYTYDKIINGLICIKRLIPSYCNICKRTHNSIDGFIFIKGDKFYLNCRRNEKSTLL